mmetsp:Transcript_49847/g.139512  ORF Transcript_49847/g.139512 Transcript_49847/m.139512 type:complete len:705 (-) Transcript_49847:99-2213(-)
MREIIFRVHCETPFGAEVRVVGASESMGRWDPTRGFRLHTCSKIYPAWCSRSITLLDEDEVEFKYVVATPGGNLSWESRPNRRLPAAFRQDVPGDCRPALVQGVFDSLASEQMVQLRPFPDRRALSHLRKNRRWKPGLGLGCVVVTTSAWYEEPPGSCSVSDDSDDTSASGITRASSTDSFHVIDTTNCQTSGGRTLLVLPPNLFGDESVLCVEAFGSFTQPPWAVPLACDLCPETGAWWLALEQALPDLQPGTYEFKFQINGQIWMTHPALPVCKNAEGFENNRLHIDYRLLTCIERRASSPSRRKERRVSFKDTGADGAKEFALKTRGRAASSADRLYRDGFSRTLNETQRTYSLPQMGRNPQTGRACIYDFVDTAAGETLYASDVAMLLDLPDMKRRTGLVLSGAASCKPKDGTGEGEDAYFVEHDAFGVADGVGGLQHVLGYTSKAFADELMNNCRSGAHASLDGVTIASRPSALAERMLCVGFEKAQRFGASTAVVASFDSTTNKLGLAVLGDSGVMVVRRPVSKCSEDQDNRVHSNRSSIVFKSPPQQHDFNYPYQLCRLPQEMSRLVVANPDKPTDCVTFDVELEEGDLVLAYTDGVDDNLHDQEVLEVCNRALSPYAVHVLGLPAQAATSPELISRTIVSAAYVRSHDEHARTPFGQEARKAGWPLAWCRGGKEDDITCVAAWVTHAGLQCSQVEA